MSIEEKEMEFQRAYDLFWHSDTSKHDEAFYKKQWDIMFCRVYEACFNTAKKCVLGLKGPSGQSIHIQDLDGKACEACIKIMTNIKEGFRPKKLSSYVYLWVYGEIFGKKERRWDQSISFDRHEKDEIDFSNYAYEINNGSYTLCKENF